jgi:hypothetical protein
MRPVTCAKERMEGNCVKYLTFGMRGWRPNFKIGIVRNSSESEVGPVPIPARDVTASWIQISSQGNLA